MRPIVAALLLGWVAWGWIVPTSAYSAQAVLDQAPSLRIGVRQPPLPIVAGAKVRTPEDTASLLAQELAAALGRSAAFTLINEQDRVSGTRPALDTMDFVILDLPNAELVQLQENKQANQPEAVPTGQVMRMMAIMRSDTDIKSWRQLKGKTVCVSQDGLYAGKLGRQYGAVELVYRAPADSLLALRTGLCDAAVHNDLLLKALLKLPEWKKFSAQLVAPEPLYQVILFGNLAAPQRQSLNQVLRQWKSKAYLDKLAARMAQDIAFEVYLDQTVPDCH